MEKLRGRVAVVTGAGGGIGAALARACGGQGMRVIAADVDEEGAAETAEAIRSGGGEALFARVDVRQRAELDALAERSFEAFGACHLLVNNAGVMVNRPVAEMEQKDWEWLLSVNLWGVIHGIGAFLPRMRAQGGEGHIVNTASMAGLLAFGGMGLGAYTTSKFAVVGLSEFLAGELEGSGIGVSVVCPGAVRTRIAESERNRPEDLATGLPVHVAEADPAHLNPQTPEQVADTILSGVRMGQLHIITHPEMKPLVELRHQKISAAFDAAAEREA
jgi:NAD(P)-dependent dehydrogenase (short-subunit alcohol dehydrogenase family)